MTGIAVRVSDGFCRKSEFRFSTKNAWAAYVRRRWPTNTICEMLRAWPRLSEGQARGILYAQASQGGIDAVLDSLSAIEAFELHLEIGLLRLNLRMEEFIEHKAEEARRERAQWEARERDLEVLGARIPERCGMAGDNDLQAWPHRPGHARLGSGEASQTVTGTSSRKARP